jgi:two-component system, chemotaxis family, sensor kinase CheA
MTPDDRLLKQLIETFNPELESLLSIITENLKKIKPGTSIEHQDQWIAEISRAGRNIKVSAFSIGVDELGRIAEYIEKLFDPSQKIAPPLIDLTSQAVSGMREAMHQFVEKKPLSTELVELLNQLQTQLESPLEKESTPIAQQQAPLSKSINPKSKSLTNTLDNEFIAKIVATFKTELQENLLIITNDLLQLEKGAHSDKNAQSLLNEVFRIAHNIKGSARGIGATDVGEIAHNIETLFALIQQNHIKIAPQIINLCLQAIDYMDEAMRCYSEGIPLTFDLANYLLQLKNYVESPTLEFAATEHPQEPNETQSSPAIQYTKINDFESIPVSLQNLDRISAYMEEIQAIKINIEENYSKLAKINFRTAHLEHEWRKFVNIESSTEPEINHFDRSFSESFIELSEISNKINSLQRELRVPVSELSLLLNALQDEVRTLRLIPVDSQLRYLPRIVRDLAHELQKSVNLEIKSNNIKIDKMILDGLKDPLVHLLRNAIDHGIESTEVRQAAGKSALGHITIDVSQEDNHIVFRVSDDGAGIKLKEIARIARQKNIISSTELKTMKKNDIYELIFRPSFTTRDVATDISGRGVGLDVVRSNLIRLKGQISLNTVAGKGTDFLLKVPLTLATERGLIISCNHQLFVFITSSVESVMLLKKEDIIKVEGSPAIVVKEQPILLCSLSEVLQLDQNEPNKPRSKLTEENKMHKSSYTSMPQSRPVVMLEHSSHGNTQHCVVIIKKNQERVAFLVDEIIGEREIVLKPLQEPLANIPSIIGATLTGSNQINFVLNATEIMKNALLVSTRL